MIPRSKTFAALVRVTVPGWATQVESLRAIRSALMQAEMDGHGLFAREGKEPKRLRFKSAKPAPPAHRPLAVRYGLKKGRAK